MLVIINLIVFRIRYIVECFYNCGLYRFGVDNVLVKLCVLYVLIRERVNIVLDIYMKISFNSIKIFFRIELYVRRKRLLKLSMLWSIRNISLMVKF